MFDRSTLKVTDAQRKELQALRKDFNPKIAKIFTDAQKTRIADLKKDQLATAAGGGAHPGRVIRCSEQRDMPWTTLLSPAGRSSLAKRLSK